ncbi:hypothetical protein PsorP6_014859 [Peronosclerospora sorghi]|uniref:Uncharacterized protein n=1 Tax=Peronosclerospora sorghi TaxID=230839 RepID=A0ACC0VU79_9STRA|nr:hypothetical protein PsorP6_014859 [Peronosclerospora sorghi]
MSEVRAHVRALEEEGTSLTLERANDGVRDTRGQRQGAHEAKKKDVPRVERLPRNCFVVTNDVSR